MSPRARALVLLSAGLSSLACTPDTTPADAGGSETSPASTESTSSSETETSSGTTETETSSSTTETETETETGALPDLGPAPAPLPPARFSAQDFSTCALLDDGSVSCWGQNRAGELGQGHVTALGDDELPCGRVELGGDVVSLASGAEHTCALRADGELFCWGRGFWGALGYANTNNVGNNEAVLEVGPVDVGDLVAEVWAGHDRTCARTQADELRCWGRGSRGAAALGYAIPGLQRVGDDEHPGDLPPIELGGIAIDVAMGANVTCAVLEGGSVRCWGANIDALGYDLGEDIGDDETPASVPPVELGEPIVELDGGLSHFCALGESGQVYCWGEGGQGALGHGDTTDIGHDPSILEVGPVPLAALATGLGLGWRHSCAITSEGALYCWGQGGAKLGHPGVGMSPGLVELPAAAEAVDGGRDHSCVQLEDELYCWGDNDEGQSGWGEAAVGLAPYDPTAFGPTMIECADCCEVELPAALELDGQVDATLELELADGLELPPGLVPDAQLHIQGAAWDGHPLCPECVNSFVARDVDQTPLILRIGDADLHPGLPNLTTIGETPQSWIAPLELEALDPGLCPVVDNCLSNAQRIAVAVDHPEGPPALAMHGARGNVSGGYMLSAEMLVDFDDDLCELNLQPRMLTLVRQDCAPDCGPVLESDSCEEPGALDYATMIIEEGLAYEIAYDVTCTVVEVGGQGPNWSVGLDCAGWF